jgi:transglutaminase-like putative cysteine protease
MLADSPHYSLPLPSGEAGTDITIEMMARMAMGKYGAGSLRMRELAASIVRDVPEKDVRGEIDAIHRWVQNRLRYVNDPATAEMLVHPESLAFDPDVRTGDCDDHAMLEAALLAAIGRPTRFVVIARNPRDAFQHVYLEAHDGREWVPLDPIMKKPQQPSGWAVPNPGRIKRYPSNRPDGTLPGPDLPITLGALALGVWLL